MQRAAIVPDHQIADLPFVHINEAGIGGEGHQFVDWANLSDFAAVTPTLSQFLFFRRVQGAS